MSDRAENTQAVVQEAKEDGGLAANVWKALEYGAVGTAGVAAGPAGAITAMAIRDIYSQSNQDAIESAVTTIATGAGSLAGKAAAKALQELGKDAAGNQDKGGENVEDYGAISAVKDFARGFARAMTDTADMAADVGKKVYESAAED